MSPLGSHLMALGIGAATRNNGRGHKRGYRIRNSVFTWRAVLAIASFALINLWILTH